MNRRIIRAACVASALLLGVALPRPALASDSAAGGAPSSAELAATGPLSRSGVDLASAIEDLGSGTYASIYAGITEVDNGRQINVYLTTLDPTAEAAFAAIAPPGVLTFHQAKRNAVELAARHQKLIDAYARLAAAGVTIVSLWPDIVTGTEHVGVLGLDATKATSLVSMTGISDLSVVNATTADIARTSATRTNDSSPFNAGDSITDDVFGCTSAFGIRISGTTYLLTASHCFAVGATIHNAACNNAACTSLKGSNVVMGTTKARDTTSGDLDTQYINTRGSRLIFTGGINDTSTVIVAGTTTSPVGAQICDSGSYSGEHCGAVIDNANTCQLFSDGNLNFLFFCNLVHATLASHGVLTEGGDSGGPVFRFSGSNALAVGTITGSTPADSATCVNFTYNACAWDLYYTNVNNILSHWGASIVTT